MSRTRLLSQTLTSLAAKFWKWVFNLLRDKNDKFQKNFFWNLIEFLFADLSLSQNNE